MANLVGVNDSGIGERSQQDSGSADRQAQSNAGGTFTCSVCFLKEHYDYKGAKPPFARQLVYSEECYVMKDPFSLPNRGEILVLGGDCVICQHAVCLGCSVFYMKRFCARCASSNASNLPVQLHGKIRNLTKHADD